MSKIVLILSLLCAISACKTRHEDPVIREDRINKAHAWVEVHLDGKGTVECGHVAYRSLHRDTGDAYICDVIPKDPRPNMQIMCDSEGCTVVVPK